MKKGLTSFVDVDDLRAALHAPKRRTEAVEVLACVDLGQRGLYLLRSANGEGLNFVCAVTEWFVPTRIISSVYVRPDQVGDVALALDEARKRLGV